MKESTYSKVLTNIQNNLVDYEDRERDYQLIKLIVESYKDVSNSKLINLEPLVEDGYKISLEKVSELKAPHSFLLKITDPFEKEETVIEFNKDEYKIPLNAVIDMHLMQYILKKVMQGGNNNEIL